MKIKKLEECSMSLKSIPIYSLATCLSLSVVQAADWQAGAGPEWTQTLAAAKAEGTLVVGGSPDMAKPFTDGFLRDTGIKLTFLAAPARDLSSRIGSELRTQSVTIDLIIGGASDLPLVKAGLATPIKPQLILPESVNPENWVDGSIRWIDKTQMYMLQSAEYVYGQPYINTSMLKPGTIKNWKDMLKPEYIGKIAAMDPRIPGSGGAAAAYLGHLFGTDFLKSFYIGQQIKLSNDPRQVTEWAARGVYPIAIGGNNVDLETFKAAGIKNVEVLDMEDGPGTTLGGFSVMWQPKGNPHPNASKIFVNWYASKPGQEAYVAARGTPTRRKDVDTSKIPGYMTPKPGLNYLETYQEDFYLGIRPKLTELIETGLGGK